MRAYERQRARIVQQIPIGTSLDIIRSSENFLTCAATPNLNDELMAVSGFPVKVSLESAESGRPAECHIAVNAAFAVGLDMRHMASICKQSIIGALFCTIHPMYLWFVCSMPQTPLKSASDKLRWYSILLAPLPKH